MSEFGVVGLVGVGIAFNTVHTVQRKQDPFPVIMAGVLFMGGCVAVEAANPRVGVALAAVFLLGSALISGPTTVDVATKAVNSKPTKKAK